MIKKYLLLRPLVLGGQIIDAGTEYDLEEAEAENIGIGTGLSEVENTMEKDKKEEPKKEEDKKEGAESTPESENQEQEKEGSETDENLAPENEE